MTPRNALTAIALVAASSLLAANSAQPAPNRHTYRGTLTSQPEAQITLVVKKKAVLFKATGVLLTCADETIRGDGLREVFVEAKLRRSGAFKRTKVTGTQYGSVYRYAFRGQVSGSQASGTFYESQHVDTFGDDDTELDCWTPSPMAWTAER